MKRSVRCHPACPERVSRREPPRDAHFASRLCAPSKSLSFRGAEVTSLPACPDEGRAAGRESALSIRPSYQNFADSFGCHSEEPRDAHFASRLALSQNRCHSEEPRDEESAFSLCFCKSTALAVPYPVQVIAALAAEVRWWSPSQPWKPKAQELTDNVR